MISTRRARVLLALAIVLCAVFAYQYAMRLQQLAAVEAEVAAKREQVAQAQLRQQRLVAELDALDAPEFLERVAREVLDMAKPGDRIVVPLKEAPSRPALGRTPNVLPTSQSAAMAQSPVWRQWVDFFAADLRAFP
jgi:cell division protein FtsB